jgi:hypothetical protein
MMFAQVDCDGLLEIRALTKPVKQSAAVVPAFCRRGAKATYWTSAIQLLDDHPGGPPGRVTGRHLMP